MKKKYVWLSCVLAGALMFGGTAGVRADNPVVETEVAVETEVVAVEAVVEVEEEPAYQNQAQAAHAANLEAAAIEKIDAEMAELQVELAEAEAAGDVTKAAEITAEIDAKASEIAGIEEGRIADLRASGMGWGDIAHELGVHPGVLGLGHSKDMAGGKKSAGVVTEEEISEATTMDMKSGKTKGHGSADTTDASGTGKGNGSKSGDKDKGDHGNKGGNDHGSGSDHGGGNGGGGGGGNGGGKGK